MLRITEKCKVYQRAPFGLKGDGVFDLNITQLHPAPDESLAHETPLGHAVKRRTSENDAMAFT